MELEVLTPLIKENSHLLTLAISGVVTLIASLVKRQINSVLEKIDRIESDVKEINTSLYSIKMSLNYVQYESKAIEELKTKSQKIAERISNHSARIEANEKQLISLEEIVFKNY